MIRLHLISKRKSILFPFSFSLFNFHFKMVTNLHYKKETEWKANCLNINAPKKKMQLKARKLVRNEIDLAQKLEKLCTVFKQISLLALSP